MILYDMLIIGAGPSGLFAALQAGRKPPKILVLEKQPNPGLKLLLTGSGQCNFTNIRPIREFSQAYGDHGSFLKPALMHFSNQDVIAFFKQQGIEPRVVEENGKVFPKSLQARDILNVLLTVCKDHKVELRFQQKVTQIDKQSSGWFQVQTTTAIYQAKNLVIATGGKSYPGTGSTGDGYSLAQSLGHSLVAPRPGLTPFFIKDFPLTDLTGTAFKNLKVTLWRKNKKIKTLLGDLLITRQGLSGPVIHNLARYAAAGDRVTLALVSFENPETFRKQWLDDLNRNGKQKTKTWIKHYPLTLALARKIMTLADVNPDASVAELSREKRLALLEFATAFPLEIQALGDFNVAMITCGGVALEEVNPKTMESRLVKGLFFVGEVLDIDGDSGGYDLQAAWSTAALAAEALNAGQDT